MVKGFKEGGTLKLLVITMTNFYWEVSVYGDNFGDNDENVGDNDEISTGEYQ